MRATATPPGRRGSTSTSAALLAAVAPSFLAVLAVAAVITSIYVWQQQQGEARVAGVKDGRTTDVRDTPSETSASPTKLSPSPTTSPSLAATAQSPLPSAPASSASVSATTSPSTKIAKRLSVVVLNQTRRTGLAARVAAQLRAAGWSVVEVGNFRGRIGASTVYYPDGASPQAAAIAKALSLRARTRPAFEGLSSSRLTVIVTDDYPPLR